jgi:hypothetical protein
VAGLVGLDGVVAWNGTYGKDGLETGRDADQIGMGWKECGTG